MALTPSLASAKSIIAFLVIFAFSPRLNAGDPPPVAQLFRAGAGAHEGQGIAVLPNGNIIATGQFAGTADFGGITLTNGGSFDYFLAAYSPTAEVLWARRAGSTAADFGSKVTIDPSGNIIVAGVIEGSLDFHGETIDGFGNKDWFIAKYTPNGDLLWVRRAGSAVADQAYDIAADASGNYFVAGRIGGSATFGSLSIGESSQTKTILAKYDSAGTAIWVREIGSADGTATGGVATDPAGNVYITGLATSGGTGPYLAKYDSEGTRQWIYYANTGFTYFEEGSGVDLDADGNIYIAGRFSANSLTLGATTLSNPSGVATGFIAKFSPAGTPLWGIKAGARGFDLDATPDGIYAIGFYNTGAPAIGSESYTANPGSLETFLAKISQTGEVLWVKTSGDFGGGPGRAIAHTASGSTFGIGESSSELFDVGTFPGGVFIVELREATSEPKPEIQIRVTGTRLQLSWPVEYTGYSIEASPVVDGAFSTSNIIATPVPEAPNTYTAERPSGNLFIRLKK